MDPFGQKHIIKPEKSSYQRTRSKTTSGFFLKASNFIINKMVQIFKTLPSFLAQSAGRFALAAAVVCYWAVVGLFALLFEEILIPEVPGVWIKCNSHDRGRKQKLYLWSNALKKNTNFKSNFLQT